MLNSEIELHDSTVSAIVKVGEQVVVFFSGAYIHKSKGRPGWDAGSGWIQAAVLSWTEAIIEGVVPTLPADIWQGNLIVDADVLENTIPVPFNHSGAVSLKLKLSSPAEIVIKGKQASLMLIGEAVYVEEFPGADTGNT